MSALEKAIQLLDDSKYWDGTESVNAVMIDKAIKAARAELFECVTALVCSEIYMKRQRAKSVVLFDPTALKRVRAVLAKLERIELSP